MDKEEFCRRFKNWKTEDLLNILRSAEKLSEISTQHGPLEELLLSYFMVFQNGNVVRDHLRSLVDALMDHGVRNMKIELDRKMKQLKTAPKGPFNCPCCDCVFENPITLNCGHTICQYCLQRKSDTNNAECSTTCPLCGNYYSDLEALSVNIVLLNIIRTRFPEKAKHAEAKRLGKSHLCCQAPEEAVESLSVALHISPKDYECLCLRSDAYLQLKLYYLALRDVNNACSLRPDLPDAFNRKAKILTKLRKFDDAVLEYLRFTVLAPSESRRNELTESLVKLFRSPEVSRLDHRIIARKFAKLLIPDEQHETTVEDTGNSSEERSNDDQASTETSDEKQKVNIGELKCSVCGRLLFRPITTQCGHTFCQECIKERFEYGPKCSRCGRNLNDSTEKKRNVTVVLEELLKTHFEAEYMKREELHAKKVEKWKRIGIDQNVEIPILVSTIAMPQQRVRMTLSHPCHRIMVRRSVEWGSRMFGMCLHNVEKGFTDYGTVVEIQATENFPGDKMVVQAIPKQRFHVLSRGVVDGCSVAKVEWLEDSKIDDSETIVHLKWRNSISHVMLKRWVAGLPFDEKACIEHALGPIPPCDSHLLLSPHGPPWLWWAMAAVPLQSQEKLKILVMPSVADRLESIQKSLDSLLKKDRKLSDANEVTHT